MKEIIIGTYKIKNIDSEKYYYGSSKNIYSRFKRHKSDLKKNTHHCIHLQRAYNKYGSDKFEYIIDIVYDTIQKAKIQEDYILNTDTNLYNVSKKSTGGDLISYHPNKKIILEKIKKAVIDRNKLLTTEQKKQLYGKKGARNGMFGKNHTDKVKLIISELNKGNNYAKGSTRSDEFKNKLSERMKNMSGVKNSFYGKFHTKESKEKMSKNKIGIIPVNRRIVICDNIEYESVKALAKFLGVSSALVIYRIKKGLYKYKNI